MVKRNEPAPRRVRSSAKAASNKILVCMLMQLIEYILHLSMHNLNVTLPLLTRFETQQRTYKERPTCSVHKQNKFDAHSIDCGGRSTPRVR